MTCTLSFEGDGRLGMLAATEPQFHYSSTGWLAVVLEQVRGCGMKAEEYLYITIIY